MSTEEDCDDTRHTVTLVPMTTPIRLNEADHGSGESYMLHMRRILVKNSKETEK
jgi:hypothetical protein